jgi:hypothetical protein
MCVRDQEGPGLGHQGNEGETKSQTFMNTEGGLGLE